MINSPIIFLNEENIFDLKGEGSNHFFGKMNFEIGVDQKLIPIGQTVDEVSAPPPHSGSEPRPAQIKLTKYRQISNSSKQGMFDIKRKLVTPALSGYLSFCITT